jgi:hypothetical protein
MAAATIACPGDGGSTTCGASFRPQANPATKIASTMPAVIAAVRMLPFKVFSWWYCVRERRCITAL